MQWISAIKINRAIPRVVINFYPIDSAIHRSNNWGLCSNVMDFKMIFFSMLLPTIILTFFPCAASYAQKAKKGCENEAR